VFSSVVALLGVLPFAGQDRTELEWLADLDKATRLASQTGRPLLVEFR